MLKLDLGCGKFKRAGYFGIDIDQYDGVDIIHDLNTGIPFDDNSVDELILSHFLEHAKNPYFIMDEIYRVCTNEAEIEIRVPLLQYWQPAHLTCFFDNWFEKNATQFEIVAKGSEVGHNINNEEYEQLTLILKKK